MIFLAVKQAASFIVFSFVFLILIQSFYYLDAVPSLYLFSKVGIPLLGAVVVLFLLNSFFIRIEIWLMVLAYFSLAIVAAVRANVVYGQAIELGFLAQIKLLNVVSFFLILYFFMYSGLSERRLEVCIFFLGFISLVFYCSLYILVPKSYMDIFDAFTAYSSSKGERWMVPYHHVLFAYYLVLARWLVLRKAGFRQSVFDLFFVGLFFGYMVVFFQQKMLLAAILAVTILSFLFFCSFLNRVVIVFLGGVFALFLFYLKFDSFVDLFNFRVDSLGIRARTISTIYSAYIGANVFDLLFGYGGLSSLGYKTLQDFYGVNFWLSDVGYVGIFFEYGLLGVVTVFVIWFAILKIVLERQCFSPLGNAAKMYIITLFMLSPLVPEIIYGIGELVFCLAVVECSRTGGWGGYEQ